MSAAQKAQPGMLCGDEVKAAVVDIGHSTCRFGAAGQDSPRHLFHSDISVIDRGEQGKVFNVGDRRTNYIPTEFLSVDGAGEEKWSIIERLMHHGIETCMKQDLKECPIFMVKNSVFSDGDKDIKELTQLCFEEMSSPALYLASSATLSSFSCGKPSTLVVDMGAAGTTITPVVDGYAINTGTINTARGGNTIDNMMEADIRLRLNDMRLKPWTVYAAEKYRASSGATTTGAGAAAVATDGSSSTATTLALERVHTRSIIGDIKQWMCFVPYVPIKVTEADRDDYFTKYLKLPPPYELPDGTLINPNASLCSAAEKLFFPDSFCSDSAHISTFGQTNKRPRLSKGKSSSLATGIGPSETQQSAIEHFLAANSINKITDRNDTSSSCSSSDNDLSVVPWNSDHDSLASLVYASVAMCDPDVRKDLLNNILIVGGTSLVNGIAERLLHELQELLPTHLKARVVPISTPVEKKNAAWIGGSILGICGSFQQLWMSKGEYEEYGYSLGETRFTH